MQGTVTTVMHDTADLEQAVGFWAQILGLEVLYNDDRYAYLGKLSEGGAHLAFQQVPEGKEVKNRVHLDVAVEDREAFAAFVISLGGSQLYEHQEGEFPPWTTMADPEGNEFCIYEGQQPDE